MTATMVALEPAPATTEVGAELATVKVWFCGHLIAHWEGPAAKAPEIAGCWEQRYGCRVDVTGVEW